MDWDLVFTAIGAGLLVLGSLFTLAAAIGVTRFPDLLCRLHAASKPQVLGLILMMAGVSITFREAWLSWSALLVVLFQLITAPIGAHLAGRAGYRTGQVDSSEMEVDEYRASLVRLIRDHQDETGESEPPAPRG